MVRSSEEVKLAGGLAVTAKCWLRLKNERILAVPLISSCSDKEVGVGWWWGGDY